MKKKKALTQRDVTGYMFSLPTLLAILVFSIYPIIQSFIISFYNHNGVKGKYIGIRNYTAVLQDPVFGKALLNTAYMGIFSLLLCLPLSLILATFINYCTKGKSFYKSIFFVPNVTSVVAAALIFTFLFYPDSTGPVNSILNFFGIPSQRFFSSPSQSRMSIVIMEVWRQVGYNAIIWLAALQSIPMELYEAASIDGAGKLKQWIHVTLPSLTPTIGFMVIMGTINMFKRFGDTFIIGGPDGNPGSSLYTLILYVYRTTFMMYQFGKASAASFLIFVMILFFTVINNTLLNKAEQ